jgi:hypothetical protein
MFNPLPTDIEVHHYAKSSTYTLLREETIPMSSPPRTPTSVHKRHSSNYSLRSQNSNRHSQSFSRRSSNTYSPATSRVGSSHGAGDSLAQEFAELDDGGGLGSLADELGGWSGDEEGEEFLEEEAFEGTTEQERDSGIDVTSSPSHTGQPQSPSAGNTKLLSPSSTTSEKERRRRKGATHASYDGSEYGSESDLEQTELVSATLEARLSVVEALARRGMEENGSEGDRVISRVTESLKDLGGQSGIESGATRSVSFATPSNGKFTC